MNKLSAQKNVVEESEIALIDILCFLKGTYKTILFFGVLGFAATLVYLVITPKQYEANVQITMAKIGSRGNGDINSPGINIEEPAVLISRLSFPTSLTPEVLVACDLQDRTNTALELSKVIKLTIPKGVVNLVDLKTFRGSEQAAQDCALAVFDLIKTSQAKMVDPYIEESKLKLIGYEDRLKKAKEAVARSDKLGAAPAAATYLSMRDEIRYLLEEIGAQKNIVASNKNWTTRMLTPIYTSDVPIAPKKRTALAVGLLGGLLLGLLVTLVRQIVLRLKKV